MNTRSGLRKPAEWIRFDQIAPRVACDLCVKEARWKHPAGGFRCAKCPRPKQ
jgi:hypothetical protein